MTRAEIIASIEAFIEDNNARSISPQDVRNRFLELVNNCFNLEDDNYKLKLKHSTTTPYVEDDIVYHLGSFYLATAPSQGAFNSGDWSNINPDAVWGSIIGTVADQADLVAYIAAQIAAVVDSSPAALNTLNKLAAALGDDSNFSTTITNLIATKVSLTGDQLVDGVKTFSSSPIVPTPTTDFQSSTKKYVDDTADAKADKNITANRQTGSYTLVLGDKDKLVEMNVAGANNLTVPPDSSVAFPTGTQILVSQYGAGQTTFVAGGGATLIKIATDEWYLFGSLTT
jgi:hypothetical protein